MQPWEAQKENLTLQQRFNNFIVELQKPTLNEKATFFRLLAVSQKAGLGIRASLVSLQQWQENKWMLMILEDMIQRLTAGSGLAEAMSYHAYFFTSEEIELLKSTEITGNMSATLEEIADDLEANQIINAKVKKALTYPTLIIVFAVLAVVVLLIKVMPAIVTMYWDPEELPWITKFMLNVSAFLQVNWWKCLILIFTLITSYKLLYKYVLLFKIMIDTLMIKVPVVKNVVKLFYMHRFTVLLSQFYAAGVSPIISFNLLANIFSNFCYKKKMIEVKNSIASGFSIFESMEWSDLFDPILIQIISVWENTGSLTDVLRKISSFYLMSLNAAIDALTAIIEPFLMVWVAGMVGTLLWAIYLPMADMVNQISG